MNIPETDRRIPKSQIRLYK